MIVEGLGSVTFVNGVLRVQLTAINAEGNIKEATTLEIPGPKVGEIIQGLATASQGIVEKLKSAEESTKDDKGSNGKEESKKSTSKNKKKN